MNHACSCSEKLARFDWSIDITSFCFSCGFKVFLAELFTVHQQTILEHTKGVCSPKESVEELGIAKFAKNRAGEWLLHKLSAVMSHILVRLLVRNMIFQYLFCKRTACYRTDTTLVWKYYSGRQHSWIGRNSSAWFCRRNNRNGKI